MTQDVDKLREKVLSVIEPEDQFEEYIGYSGRGMFGSKSVFAFTCNIHPNSFIGEKIVKFGFRVDNMGHDFIYYLT